MRTDLTEEASCEPGIHPDGRRKHRAAAGAQRAGLSSNGTAGSDSGKATTRVIRRGPFHHHHHQPARHPPNCPRPSSTHHPAERRLVVLSAALANRCHTEARFARAVCCYRLYGDCHIKIAPDRKLFSARTGLGQRGCKKSICDRELDIERHAWVALRYPARRWPRYMSPANDARSMHRQFAVGTRRVPRCNAPSRMGVCRTCDFGRIARGRKRLALGRQPARSAHELSERIPLREAASPGASRAPNFFLWSTPRSGPPGRGRACAMV